MLGKRGLTISSIVTIIILSFGVLGLVGYSFSAERTANLSPVSCEQADVNRDGRVDLIDMSLVKSKNGEVCWVLYDDFSSGVLDADKWVESTWHNRPFTDEHYVNQSEGRYHVVQNFPRDAETNLVVNRVFYPGESLRYEIIYNGGSGNHQSQPLINGNYPPSQENQCFYLTAGCGPIGYWNALPDLGNQIGTYKITQEFLVGKVIMTAIRPDNVVVQNNFTGVSAPYTFTLNTHTGHDGIMHFDLDNFYVKTSNQVCMNECSISGQQLCNGGYIKKCGNYDADTCLEWNNNYLLCANGCNGGVCFNGDIVGFWNFNEESGSAAYDLSGNQRDGLINGAVYVGGKNGTGLYFDGNDYVDIPNTNDLDLQNGFILSAWVKFDDYNDDNVIVGKHVSGYVNGYFIGVQDNKFDFYVNNPPFLGEDRLRSSRAYNDGEWHYVVGVYNGTTQYLYVDGILEAQQSKEYSIFNSANLRIGGIFEGQDNGAFIGSIDEVVVQGMVS